MKSPRPISTRHTLAGYQDGWHSPECIVIWEINGYPNKGREYTWTCSCGTSNLESQKAERAARNYNVHMMSRTQDHLYTLKPEALENLPGYHQPHKKPSKHPAPHSMGSAIWDPTFSVDLENLRDQVTGQLPTKEQLERLRAAGYTFTPIHDFHGRPVDRSLIVEDSIPAASLTKPAHQTAHTVTKQIRHPNPTNWQTFGALHNLLHDLEKTAEENHTTLLPATIRLEARPNHGGTELTIHAFSKPQ